LGLQPCGVRALKKTAILVALLLALQVLGSVQVNAAGTTATPIKHVIMIMMENHSFDNLFGLYPTMDRAQPGALLGSLQRPDDVLDVPNGVSLAQVPNSTYATANPNEDVYSAYWDNGKMDGFASNGGGMTYFGPSQFAVEWDWAEQYAIADRYFASCLCMTNPNRLFSLSGYGAGLTTDSGPPPYVPVNQSIFGELGKYGVSWGYYVQNPSTDNFPLNYFDGIGAYSSQVQSFSAFDSALQQGTLPAVSWVMPVGGGAEGIDQHPVSNVTYGQSWLLGIVDRVMQSQYWNSSAIFITYDEGGGYYDHVPPPVVDGVQLGFRIPLFVISPYAKENYVSSTVMNHASSLSFVDYNWGLPALNSYVAESGLPLDMFDFNQTYSGGTLVRQPIVLANNSQFPTNLQIPIGDLPYQRTGSTGATLASLGSKLYVSSNSSTTPFTESLPFTSAVAAALIVLMIVVARFARSKQRAKPSGNKS
jgi:phospholipase C